MKSDQILHIQTNQPDELKSFISQNLIPARRVEPVQEKWQTDFRVYRLNELSAIHATFPFGLSIALDPIDKYITLEVPLSRQFQLSNYQNLSTYICPSNSCFIVEQPTNIFFNKTTVHNVLLIPKKLIRTYALKMNNNELTKDFQIQSGSLLITEEIMAFRRYLTFIISEFIRGGQLFQSSSTILEIEKTILSLLISNAKKNNFNLDDHSTVACHPKYINRAIDYIDANLSKPLSLADLATAAGVHSRTLSNGFKKYYNMSPMAYVKEKRLEKTRQLLLEADPISTNVTDIATQYNFFHLGRFAQDYFHLFHELPSETLRDQKMKR